MTDGFTIPIIIANNEYGLDRHVWDVPLGNITRELLEIQGVIVPNNVSGLLKFGYAARISLQLAGNFTRMSLVCFYFRLVEGGHHRRFILILRAALALLVVYCVVFFFPAVFACNPIKAYWMLPPPPNATCLPEGNWAFTAGVVSCIMDVMVMILPVPIIMNLSMTLRKRVVVIVLLNLGLLATIAGVLRTYYTWRSLLRSYDTTWEGYGLWITAAIEVNTGIVGLPATFCLCTLNQLTWFDRYVPASRHYDSYSGNGSGLLAPRLAIVSTRNFTVIAVKAQMTAPANPHLIDRATLMLVIQSRQ